MNALLAKEIKSHKEKGKPDENQDFIDYYLDEIDKVSLSELFYTPLTQRDFKYSFDYNDV